MIYWVLMHLIISFIHYCLLLTSHFSFSLALVLYLLQFLYEKLWIKIHIQSKSFPERVKNKHTGVAFKFCRFYLSFKIHKRYIIVYVRFINYVWVYFLCDNPKINQKKSHFVAKYSNFSHYPSNVFFQKHLATNLPIFLIYLPTFDKCLKW